MCWCAVKKLLTHTHSFIWYKNVGGTYLHFVTIHACDGRTDGIAIRKTALHTMQSGKNLYEILTIAVYCLCTEGTLSSQQCIVYPEVLTNVRTLGTRNAKVQPRLYVPWNLAKMCDTAVSLPWSSLIAVGMRTSVYWNLYFFSWWTIISV